LIVDQTTASLQTPPGRGGIAVIMLAGPRARAVLGGVFRPWPSHSAERDGHLQLGYLVDGERRIDQVVICRHPGGIEINIHGGPQVAREAMTVLKRSGATPTEASPAAAATFPTAHPTWDNPAIGAEMLTALPRARSPLVAEVLTRQWSAGLSRLARQTVQQLDTNALAEATTADVCRAAAEALGITSRLLDPPEVVLAGPPNAGKSTLANALVGREVSIVHRRAGTTRDWVRELALLDGVPIWLTDTAGLWTSNDSIDAEAVQRAHARASEADLVLLLSAETPAELPRWWQADRVIHVASKCDELTGQTGADVSVSARTSRGLDELRYAIVTGLGLANIQTGAPMAFTPRQSARLAEAASALDDGNACSVRTALVHLLEG